jgi:hypothetical protein
MDRVSCSCIFVETAPLRLYSLRGNHLHLHAIATCKCCRTFCGLHASIASQSFGTCTCRTTVMSSHSGSATLRLVDSCGCTRRHVVAPLASPLHTHGMRTVTLKSHILWLHKEPSVLVASDRRRTLPGNLAVHTWAKTNQPACDSVHTQIQFMSGSTTRLAVPQHAMRLHTQPYTAPDYTT